MPQRLGDPLDDIAINKIMVNYVRDFSRDVIAQRIEAGRAAAREFLTNLK